MDSSFTAFRMTLRLGTWGVFRMFLSLINIFLLLYLLCRDIVVLKG